MGTWDLFDEADEVVFLTKEEYRRLVKNYNKLQEG